MQAGAASDGCHFVVVFVEWMIIIKVQFDAIVTKANTKPSSQIS